VKIRVGQQPLQKTFVVHEDIISRSEYFRRAMNGNWAESDNRIVSLLEDDPHTFSIYLHMVHTNRFPEPTTFRDISTKGLFARFIKSDLVQLAKVYVLAEKLQDTATKNAIVREIMAKSAVQGPDGSKYCPDPIAINIIYNGTPKGNPCRRLVVHMWTDELPKTFTRDVESLPREFLGELALTFRDHYDRSIDGLDLISPTHNENYFE